MLKPSIPANEAERLAQLDEYDIMDSFSEKDYDDITQLAAAICKTPISLITLVDEKRQWFKSKIGIESSETARDYAFCAHALNAPDEILIVPDSRKDKRFEGNPLVTSDPHVIFYTGVPLVNPEGYALGTLCVIDHKPRQLSDEQLSALKILSRQIINLLELRKINAAFKRAQHELQLRNKELEQFASVLSHDIKSPLTNILIANEILQDEKRVHFGEEDSRWFALVKKSADKINSLVNGVLAYYKSDSNQHHFEKINLTELVASVTPVLSSSKIIEISYPQDAPVIQMNKTQLEQILLNLINNSIRYNDKEVIRINIEFEEDARFYYITVSDNGIGIEAEDQEKIFNLFTSLTSKDLYETKGYGIGLSTVKKIVEKNNGSMKVKSSLGEGATFSFSIKKTIA